MTATEIVKAKRPDLAKGALLVLSIIGFAIVCYADKRFLVDSSDREWVHIAPFKWILLVHGIFAASALLTGATQFWDALRTRRPQVHRMLGRVYIASALIGGLASLAIQLNFEPWPGRLAGISHSMVFLTSTGFALAAIRQRNIPLHRAWMMKSYAMCLIFIVNRLPDAVPNLEISPQLSTAMLFLEVMIMFIACDVILTVRELNRKRRRG